MSNRTLAIALVVALSLGIVTLLVVKRPGGGAPTSSGIIEPGARLLELDPASVQGITIAPPGPASGSTRLTREAGDVWRLRVGSETGGAASPSWRVDPERVRSLLRILGTVVTVAKPEPEAALGEGATAVSLQLTSGQSITLRFAGRVLGGQGLVEVASPAANVPVSTGAGASAGQPTAPAGTTVTRLGVVASSLHALFQGEGARAWRETTLLPGVLAEASRVRLVSGDRALALARVQGRWGLTEPLASPADPAAVQRLLTALEAARIARFFDERAPGGGDKTGLDAPTARVVIESDAREPGPDGQIRTTTSVRELLIGEALDATGKQRYATTDGGATLVAVDATSLAEVKVDPAVYLSRTATPTTSSDIGLIMLEGVPAAAPAAAAPGTPVLAPVNMGFLRTLDGWYELRPDGTRIMTDPKRAAAIAELTRFLTTEPAAGVWMGEPSGYQAIGTMKLKTDGDAPLDELQIGRHAGAGVAIKSGRVTRTYARTPDLLLTVLGPIEPAPGTPGASEPKDINK